MSAAITSFIAQGENELEACIRAKKYLTQALIAAKDNSVGYGNGPVHHFYNFWNQL